MKALFLTFWQLGYADACHGFEMLPFLKNNKEYRDGYKEGESTIPEYGFVDTDQELFS